MKNKSASSILVSRRSLLYQFASVALAWRPGLMVRSLPQPSHSARTFDITDFGAVGDGVASSTVAIQKAIDSANAAGGGIVLFPRGQYVTGTILLKSNVTLSLSAGAILQGSLEPDDYLLVEPFIDGVGTARGYALIACRDAHHIAIRGPGTIDGRGAALQAAAAARSVKSASARPFLILCIRSTDVKLENVQLSNSGAWTVHIFQCADVLVQRISLRSVGLANNDGIDIDSSSRVLVSACDIESDDDAICLKTTSMKPCHDITVRDCTLSTRCAAIKLGTESAGDFHDIHVADCHILKANLGAIKLLSVDGANISNILVERISVDEADTPVFLRLGARGRVYRPADQVREPGSISGIRLRHITVARARRIGIMMCGLPAHPIGDVRLEHISIDMAGDPVRHLPPEPPELPSAYPEVRMFGADLPSSGIYGRHLHSLHLRDIVITRVQGDVRPTQMLRN